MANHFKWKWLHFFSSLCLFRVALLGFVLPHCYFHNKLPIFINHKLGSIIQILTTVIFYWRNDRMRCAQCLEFVFWIANTVLNDVFKQKPNFQYFFLRNLFFNFHFIWLHFLITEIVFFPHLSNYCVRKIFRNRAKKINLAHLQ